MNRSQHLNDWIENRLSIGRNQFSLDELRTQLADKTETALRRSLDRLSAQNRLVSIFNGYYLVVPPAYRNKGVLPPALFIDGLMNHLKRPYYVALLNAAAYYGAAQQQPQFFFVVTNFPVLRPIEKKGLKIEWISRETLPDSLLEKRKTETGYFVISSAEQTAADLVHYEKRIGGLSRAASVISELAESMKIEKINAAFVQFNQVATLQRLGFILEAVLGQNELANQLFDVCKENNRLFRPTFLQPNAPKENGLKNQRWKIIINSTIEIDE